MLAYNINTTIKKKKNHKTSYSKKFKAKKNLLNAKSDGNRSVSVGIMIVFFH